MTLSWTFWRVDENRPDRAQAGICNHGGSAHLAPNVWRFGNESIARGLCEQHLRMVLAGSTSHPLYERLSACPKWSRKPNPKHEHGTECQL